MKSIRTSLRFVALLLLLTIGAISSASSNVKMLIEWGDISSNNELVEDLQDSGVFEDAVGFINDTFRFARPLVLQFGSDDGPLYDPQLNAIQVPYEFYAHVISLVAQLEPNDKSLQKDYAIDSMLHTLFHEYGHAVIDQYNIPVLGKEEDAVDALASAHP